MVTFSLITTIVMLYGPPARAEDLCEPRESIRRRVTYCHENFEYLDPAQACVAEYKALVASEQKRLKAILDSQLQNNAADAQKANFHVNSLALRSAIDDLDYLLDYGKQVHTELEDYEAEMVLPIYDEDDESPDMSDEKTVAKFMDRDCFGEPTQELNDLELKLRPDIADLEKTKEAAQALLRSSDDSESRLDVSESGARSLARGRDRRKLPNVAKGTGPRSSSTITGAVKSERLPAAKP